MNEMIGVISFKDSMMEQMMAFVGVAKAKRRFVHDEPVQYPFK